MSENRLVRVRFEPALKGYLRLTSLRTALYNYLFARKENGSIILRIADLSIEFDSDTSEKNLINDLKAFGLAWDEGPDIGGVYGPYRQSQRISLYSHHLSKLIEDKRAYWCFCTEDDLNAERNAMLSAGITPKYSGRCKHLDEDQIKHLKASKKSVIRLSSPSNTQIEFNDSVFGKKIVNSDSFGDIIIADDINHPRHIFMQTLDDYLMEISHVIRSYENISFTPQQITILSALEAEFIPKYVHLPPLSPIEKIPASTKIFESRCSSLIKKYNQNAILHYLATLGLENISKDKIYTTKKLIEEFSLKNISQDQLWLNSASLSKVNRLYKEGDTEIKMYNEIETID